jgi:hypothetical protein
MLSREHPPLAYNPRMFPTRSTRRRLAALLTLAAVAWAALWPAISSAHAAMAHEAVMLCHQAGGEVDPSMPTRDPGKTHCPLCLMAFYGAHAPEVVVAPPAFSSLCVQAAVPVAAHTGDVSVHLPQGRAPPA